MGGLQTKDTERSPGFHVKRLLRGEILVNVSQAGSSPIASSYAPSFFLLTPLNRFDQTAKN